jgi:diguanylate cyclase (GGDEF)-like protein
MLRNVLQPNGRVATLAGPPTSARIQQYAGFLDALRNNSPEFDITEFGSGEALLEAMGGAGPPFDGLYLGWSECAQLSPILARVVSPARAVAFGMTPITTPHLQSGILCAVIDSSLYYQGYLAVQKAYECANGQSTESRWTAIPSSVMLSAHASGKGQHASTHLVMEAVLRQRTRQLHTYKEELGRANARLMSEVETDSLTGLLNRRRFEEIMEEAAAARTDRDGPVTVLMVAMDDLSEIDELLGQTAVDQAVQAVGDALQKACTSDAVLARTGMGEFAVLSQETTAVLAQGLTERILRSVAEARMATDPDCTFTVSVRLTCTPLSGRSGLKRPAANVSLPKLRKAS